VQRGAKREKMCRELAFSRARVKKTFARDASLGAQIARAARERGKIRRFV
jgi:hypothetical protein